MTQHFDRRELFGHGGRWLPAAGAAALLAPALAASPASAETRAFPLTGTWDISVTILDLPDLPPERGLFAFTGDGLIIGTGGASKIVGFGTWRAVSGTAFSTDYRHFIIEDDQVTGAVHVRQDGALESVSKLTMSGAAQRLDADGQVVATLRTRAAGTRFGFSPPRLGS